MILAKTKAWWQKQKSQIGYIRQHVLGINLRNSEFIFKHNPKHLYPLVDDKILTKDALARCAIPNPEMYFSVRSYFDLKTLETNLNNLESFVIKPANGFGGEGVLIIVGKSENGFRMANDEIYSLNKIKSHVQEILSGVYSLNQMPDSALCEYKINGQKDVMNLSFKGIPDIRILVFRGIPVMGMLRLSTKQSKGKANLHQGGIGVGVNLATGITTHAYHDGTFISHHPDSHFPLIGFSIPRWQELLSIAVSCYEAVPLGYLGVDLVLDETLGPLVLELNARPGLQLQMANRMGIRKTLESLQNDKLIPKSSEEKITLGISFYENSLKDSNAFLDRLSQD